MEERDNVSAAVAEVKEATEEQLKAVIEQHFERVRIQGMRIGASYIAAGVYGVIQKHTNKPSPSLRDYKRMTEDIIRVVAVQLKTEQNDSEDSDETLDTTETEAET